MIPKECKRLAEVDFPIAVVSRNSAKENSVHEGHPKNLHLWWARRPLAACRAVLLALLLPDVCDQNCPSDFKREARTLLARVQGRSGGKDLELQNAILKFIGDFSSWDLATNPRYLEVARGLVKAAHGDERPFVADPFAGGGSIPLEALRIGCEAFGTDLNPVAGLILKCALEDAPREGAKLLDELQDAIVELKKRVVKRMREYYPFEANRSQAVAYIWARTVRCESPNCGAEIPLIRSLSLSENPRRLRALHFEVKRGSKGPYVEFTIFIPKSLSEVQPGSVSRARATCFACRRVLAPERVRVQLTQQHGGADADFDSKGNRIGGARLLAVAELAGGSTSREYRVATVEDYEPVWRAEKAVRALSGSELSPGLARVPNEPLVRVPVPFGVINVWVYGVESWGGLFTARQKLLLMNLSDEIREMQVSEACRRILALSIGKIARHSNVVSKWHRGSETVAAAFGMQAVPMSWDFPEASPFSPYAGSLDDAFGDTVGAVGNLIASAEISGQAELGDAARLPLPDDSAAVWFTDPPYYDAVPYSYVSDFFYIWLRRSLFKADPSFFRDPLTPKGSEIVAYLGPDGDAAAARRRFEVRLGTAFAEARRRAITESCGSMTS